MFIVKIRNLGCTFYLRGTIWSASLDRADKYQTVEVAQHAIEKARPFTKPALMKTCRITNAYPHQ